VSDLRLDPGPLPVGRGIPAADGHQTPTRVRQQGLSLLKRVEALAACVHRDSSNSSRPPSTDSPTRKRYRRMHAAERRTPGGPRGHPGDPQVLLEPTATVSLLPDRRLVLKWGLAVGSVSLPWPYTWAWAQSDGVLKLIRLPKIALVIGNSRYRNAPLLKNPANDANGMGNVLKAVGFEVTLRLDSTRAEMAAAIQAYVQALAKRKGVGLFYFAGHGMQLAWRNFLLPVDAVVKQMEDVYKQGVDVGTLLQGLTQAANPMNLIVLDACRENPFARDFRVEQQGLSQLDAPPGTLLAYATSPGNVASDGDGTHGLYTEHLLRELQVKEVKIEDVFHIPPDLVVTPRASHHMLDISTRYPHHVSSAPTAISREMRHGTNRQNGT
jgi:hypothetical protein